MPRKNTMECSSTEKQALLCTLAHKQSANRMSFLHIYKPGCLLYGICANGWKIVLSLFLVMPLTVFSQSKPYVVTNYTSENGLPQNTVKKILFDKQGFCWFSTEAGLVRFDNRNFKVFGHDNVDGLRSERIVAMSATRTGEIYAQNTDYQDVTIVQNGNNKATRPALVKNAMYYYPDNGWLSTNDRISAVWDSLTLQIHIPELRHFTTLKNKEVYLQNGKQLFYINGQYSKKISESSQNTVCTSPVGDACFIQLWKDHTITVWRKGIQSKQKEIVGDYFSKMAISLAEQEKLLWCPTGTFLYANRNLYAITENNGVVSSKLVLENLPFATPLSIYYDNFSNIFYVGTSTEGLYIIKISDFVYPKIPLEFAPFNFYTLIKTSNDDIITQNIVVPRSCKPYAANLDNNFRIAAYMNNDNSMYYESGFRLCKYLFPADKVKTLLQLDDQLVSVLPVKAGNGILACTKKTLFFLSDQDSLLWEKRLPTNNKATGLYFYNDRYLLATNKGLFLYDMEKNKVECSILDSFYIRSVFIDGGHVWIGTDGNGAFLYQNKRVYPLPLGTQKALKTIHAFIPDGRGYFWLPTNNGLFKVGIDDLEISATKQKKNVYLYMFNKKNGLRTNEFNGGCIPQYQWLSDSTLVLPSLNGLVEFKPKDIHVLYPESQIYIDEIVLDGIANRTLDQSKHIELPPNFRALSLEVSCPYFGNIENLQLEYAILGSDTSQWLSVPDNGQIQINTLPDGNYKLIVRKAGESLNSIHFTLEIRIRVLPYYYRTWWFYSLLVIIGITASLIAIHLRIRNIKNEKLKIEKLVNIRTSELDGTIKLLVQSESDLRKSNHVKDQLIAMITHDLRSPVRFLSTISNYLVRQFNVLEPKSLFGRLRELNSSISSLKGFIEQFFSWAISQSNDFQVHKETFSISEVFSDVKSLYTEILSFNNNTLEIGTADLACYSDKHILSLVLRNLVDNANKNTDNGTIALRCERKGNDLYVYVSDTGNGLRQDEMDLFVSASQGLAETGHGSILILNMLQKIKGRLVVESRQNKGSLFTVIIPAS